MRENYLTIPSTGTNELIISKSRFIAHCSRAESEDEALDFILKIKKEHSSATHNCSAYLIGEHDQIQKANDDGEPSGTAGVPMLEVLKKQGLKDIVVVVTRYFGGIKLGAGGLVRAYGKATTLGIEAAGIVECRLHALIKISVDYTLLGKLEHEIRNSDYLLDRIEYLEGVDFSVNVERESVERFSEWITNLTSGQSTITVEKYHFLEFEK
ncbi:YigZ family protein [Kurthia zopfii]|uniref:IMPACT family member yigZ n=1 Tax=Kurthia zopfii TaxID=1650 RepID=A0A2U3ADS7_9BACL|nr:YigZ family protein [Kurthia zopfii]PWI22665.1 YigZ family protein [Kurthia zopfii]TDR39234.1 putative YigZ family protein [Kurthia zopfii]STX08776.1 IMPACT family member yigZ [Kurthia zopfii]VEI04996.1 IMPACT family member yigZ [Kurthia zopfii]GEK31451.1 YigZ family protein [Kurthia zopfii]